MLIILVLLKVMPGAQKMKFLELSEQDILHARCKLDKIPISKLDITDVLKWSSDIHLCNSTKTASNTRSTVIQGGPKNLATCFCNNL